MDSFADRYHGAMARNWDIRADFAEAEEQRDDWIPFLEGEPVEALDPHKYDVEITKKEENDLGEVEYSVRFIYGSDIIRSGGVVSNADLISDLGPGPFREGDRVKWMDPEWYPAVIRDIRYSRRQYRVHYEGFHAENDCWVSRDQVRFPSYEVAFSPYLPSRYINERSRNNERFPENVRLLNSTNM